MMNYLWMQNSMMQYFPQLNNMVMNIEHTPETVVKQEEDANSDRYQGSVQ